MVMRVTKEQVKSRLLACDQQAPKATCCVNDIKEPEAAA
jgi:hypothetical protein